MEAAHPILQRLADSAFRLAGSTVDRLQQAVGLDPDTTHEFRVASKRLRSFWLLAAGVVGQSQAKPYMHDLRDAARPLAAQRDDYVREELLLWLQDRAGKTDARAISFIREDLFGDKGATEPSSDFDVESGIAALWADSERWEQTARDSAQSDHMLIVDGFQDTYSRARQLGETALLIDTPRGYHKWRRWVKYTYYQYSWFRAEYPGASESIEKHLKQLGSVLGKLHDVHHLQQELEERSLRTASPQAFRLTRDHVLAREEKLKRKISRLAARLLAKEPPLVTHEVLKAVRSCIASATTPDLEFISLADHEGDGATAATRAADS